MDVYLKNPLIIFITICSIIISTSCESPQVRSIPFEKRMVVAVTDFKNSSGLDDIDDILKQLGETQIFELQNTKCFRIITRNRIDAILKEHSFSMAGFVDPVNMKTIGKIIGVDALLIGTLSKTHYAVNESSVGKTITRMEQMDIIIDASLISVETGRIYGSSKAEAVSNNSYSEAGQHIMQGKKMTKIDLVNEALKGTAKKIARDIARQVSDR
jgi:curli biogenesis system outer membrane secretion channel CsgG